MASFTTKSATVEDSIPVQEALPIPDFNEIETITLKCFKGTNEDISSHML
jgi:hypothetical protein